MNKYIVALLASLVWQSSIAQQFDWGELKRERIDLKLPLLTVQGQKGLLACGYINVATCDKTGEACAVVTGVSNHDDMLIKPVVAVSAAASALGIVPGMSGADALQLMR